MSEVPGSFYEPSIGPESTSESITLNPFEASLDIPSQNWEEESREDFELLQNIKADLTPDGKIPIGSRVQKVSRRICSYIRPTKKLPDSTEVPIDETPVCVLPDGCRVFVIGHQCTEATEYYWVRGSRRDKIAVRRKHESYEWRTVIVCGGAVVNRLDVQVWTPPSEFHVNARKATSTLEDGFPTLVYEDFFWGLHLPVRMINQCDGIATYRLMTRVEKYKTFYPHGPRLVSLTESVVQPEATKEMPFRIPDCPPATFAAKHNIGSARVSGSLGVMLTARPTRE